MRNVCVALYGVLLCLLVWGCSQDAPPKVQDDKGLLIFCGITMIDPVKELMLTFERQTGIKSTMSYGGSADLLHSIQVNKAGDIYFPGAESFIADADKADILRSRRVVGHNQAALFVQKGNPKGLTGSLQELTRPDVRLAIGHPDLGSIGKESYDILNRKGIYDNMMAAAAMLLPDSKALSAALKEGKVDVVINWKPVLLIGDNAKYMEMLPLLDVEAKRHELTMATTKFSASPEAAEKFLAFCASEQGRGVFEKYGF